MSTMADIYQTADWKTEKHMPVIECPETVASGAYFDVHISLGKEIKHPNTSEHHIRWIQLFFKPARGKISYQLGTFYFEAHGESAKGLDMGPAITDHSVTTRINIREPGEIIASTFCNIHGFWESSKTIALEAESNQ
ncbi:MAG: class II SORL domain-containing protein [Anaerolineales bacterium]|nr:class II SORL domain-containing protein [Anaerolineales bacterium]